MSVVTEKSIKANSTPSQHIPAGTAKRLGIALLLLSCAVGMTFLFRGSFGDEGSGLTRGWLVSRGYGLYRDIYMPHFPFLTYWVAAVVGLFGRSMFALRVSVVIFQTIVFAVTMRYSRYYLPLGLAALTWMIISPLYHGNMLMYDAISGPALAPMFAVTLAIIAGKVTPGRNQLLAIGIACAIALLCNPLSIYPVALTGLALLFSRAGVRGAFVVFVLAVAGLGIYFGYLLLTGVLTQFVRETFQFNSDVYSRYSGVGPLELGRILDLSVRMLGIFDQRWFKFDPFVPLANVPYPDRWLFTGFLFRFGVVVSALAMLWRRRYRMAGFAFFFAIMTLVRTDEGFHAGPFVVVALFLCWGLVTGQWLTLGKLTATQSGAAQGRSWYIVLLSTVPRVLIVIMLAWLVIRGVALPARGAVDLTYEGNFGDLERQAEALHSFGCGTEANLAVYPYVPYLYFFSGMEPVDRYYLMLPWMAEVYLDDLISDLGVRYAVVCVDRSGSIWEKENSAFLAPLIEYLETSYVQSPRHADCYLSPQLASECLSSKVN